MEWSGVRVRATPLQWILAGVEFPLDSTEIPVASLGTSIGGCRRMEAYDHRSNLHNVHFRTFQFRL
jgi:hypothetical protein